jgi:hypothetical protein
MVRAMNDNEAKAKWDRIIAKRNAEFERKVRDDPERARDEALESVAALLRRLGLPPLIFERADETRKRLAALNERLGILPPIEDKAGIAKKEIAEARATIESCVEILKLRIGVARPVRDDAYWQSHWALYSDDELLNNLIGAAMRGGAYVLDTPSRQALDQRRVSSSLGKKRGKASGKARTESASKKWQDRAIDMANEIRAKKQGFSVAAIAKTVEAQWSGTFPVGFRRLYDFLRARNKGGLFEKSEHMNMFKCACQHVHGVARLESLS